MSLHLMLSAAGALHLWCLRPMTILSCVLLRVQQSGLCRHDLPLTPHLSDFTFFRQMTSPSCSCLGLSSPLTCSSVLPPSSLLLMFLRCEHTDAESQVPRCFEQAHVASAVFALPWTVTVSGQLPLPFTTKHVGTGMSCSSHGSGFLTALLSSARS